MRFVFSTVLTALFVGTILSQGAYAQAAPECSESDLFDRDSTNSEILEPKLDESGEPVTQGYDETFDAAGQSEIGDSDAAGFLAGEEDLEAVAGVKAGIAAGETPERGALRAIVEEIPVVDLVLGVGFEISTIVDAVGTDIENKYDEIKLAVDVTLETIGNFLPPVQLLTVFIETQADRLLNHYRTEYLASVYAEYYSGFHRNAVTLADIEKGHEANYKRYLRALLERTVDEMLVESEAFHRDSINGFERFALNIIANHNQKAKDAFNIALTPKNDLLTFQGKPIFDNHYGVLSNVCDTTRQVLFGRLSEENKVSGDVLQPEIRQHLTCVYPELIERLKKLARLTSTEIASPLEEVILNLFRGPGQIYGQVKDKVSDDRFLSLFKSYIRAEAESAKESLINNDAIGQVFTALGTEYSAITAQDKVEYFRKLAMDRSSVPPLPSVHTAADVIAQHVEPYQFINWNGVPSFRTCQRYECRALHPVFIDTLGPGDPYSSSGCNTSTDGKQGYWPQCAEWAAWTPIAGDPHEVSLRDSLVGDFDLDTYLSFDADLGTHKPIGSFTSFKILDAAARYYKEYVDLFYTRPPPAKERWSRYPSYPVSFSFLNKDRSHLESIPGLIERSVLEKQSGLGSDVTTYSVGVSPSTSSNMIARLYGVLDGLSEQSPELTCASYSQADYGVQDLSFSYVEFRDSCVDQRECEVSHGLYCPSHCSNFRALGFYQDSASYTYLPDENACQAKARIAVEFTSTVGRRGAHQVSTVASERTFKIRGLPPLVDLQSRQIAQLKAMEPYLALHEHLPLARPDYWPVTEAKAIHQAMQLFIADNHQDLRYRNVDFYKGVLFSLLRNFLNPFRTGYETYYETLAPLRANDKFGQSLLACCTEGYEDWSEWGFPSSNALWLFYDFPAYVIDGSGRYVLVRDIDSHIQTITHSGAASLVENPESSSDQFLLPYSFPARFGSAREEANTLGLYTLYVQLVEESLSNYKAITNETFVVETSIDAVFTGNFALTPGPGGKQKRLVKIESIDDYLLHPSFEDALAKEKFYLHRNTVDEQADLIEPFAYIDPLLAKTTLHTESVQEVIDLILTSRWAAESFYNILYRDGNDIAVGDLADSVKALRSHTNYDPILDGGIGIPSGKTVNELIDDRIDTSGFRTIADYFSVLLVELSLKIDGETNTPYLGEFVGRLGSWLLQDAILVRHLLDKNELDEWRPSAMESRADAEEKRSVPEPKPEFKLEQVRR